MTTVLVVGSASRDVLHLPDGRTVRNAGGAGLFTALAAARAGAEVILLAPRPTTLPPELAALPKWVRWVGPQIAPESLPSLEIAHYGHGQAALLGAEWGAEPQLHPDLLHDLKIRPVFAYCAPLSQPARQLAFVQAFNRRGWASGCGTYARAVSGQTTLVRQTLQASRVFCCNENEANLLFGSLDAAQPPLAGVLAVTQAAAGATVLCPEMRWHCPAPPMTEVDPTGAGDTFAGTFIALLAQGVGMRIALEQAVQAASAHVAQIGPAGLEGFGVG